MAGAGSCAAPSIHFADPALAASLIGATASGLVSGSPFSHRAGTYPTAATATGLVTPAPAGD